MRKLVCLNKRREEIKQNYDPEEEEQEELNDMIHHDEEAEDDFILEIANIYGVIFSVYK